MKKQTLFPWIDQYQDTLTKDRHWMIFKLAFLVLFFILCREVLYESCSPSRRANWAHWEKIKKCRTFRTNSGKKWTNLNSWSIRNLLNLLIETPRSFTRAIGWYQFVWVSQNRGLYNYVKGIRFSTSILFVYAWKKCQGRLQYYWSK